MIHLGPEIRVSGCAVEKWVWGKSSMAFQSFVMCLPKKWRKWRKSKPISLWNLRNPSFRYTIRHYLRLLKRWWHLRTYDIMRYFKGRRPQFFYRAEIGYFKEYHTIMCVLWFDPFLIVCYFFTVWCSASINIWRGGKFISSSKMKIRFESWFLFCVCVCAEKYKDITNIRICQVQIT